MYLRRYLQPALKQATIQRACSISTKSLQRATFFAPSKHLRKPSLNQESFASGTTSVYMEQMYDQWKKDPNSVHASWRNYFQNIENGAATPYVAPPTLGQTGNDQMQQILAQLSQGGLGAVGGQITSADTQRAVTESQKLMLLIRSYMTHGHLDADLDPLQLEETYRNMESLPEKFMIPQGEMLKVLDYKTYGFTEADLDREFYIDVPELAGLLSKSKIWKLRDLIQAYKNAYCGKIGVEYMHIMNREQCNWIRDRFEGLQYQKVTDDKKIQNFERLYWASELGDFLGYKFNTMKRFGLEGCETFVPGLKVACDTLVDRGVEKIFIGMPHRGRMNVLANVVRKPLEQIFAEFQLRQPLRNQEDDWSNSGDVKYHLGTSYRRTYPDGKKLMITVLANPSHLEAVDPVVMGRARAEQHFMGDHERTKVCPILIHGDAAFAGQGVVYESMQMQQLYNYRVGGTIHVVVNNQIGFTTSPIKSRSTVYCTDLAKALNAPIFHVNGDSMNDVGKTFRIAAKFRQKFKTDVVIDLIGYRKHGHNELDQPMFTQPLMYKKVAKMIPVAKKFEQQLIEEGVLTPEKVKEIKTHVKEELNKAYESSKTYEFKVEEWMSDEWEKIKDPQEFGKVKDTGVQVNFLKEIGSKITHLPEDWDFHPQIKKIYELRRKSIQEGKQIDWGTAESLAFASLIHEGYHVRLSGQDVERGTFSHRHAIVFDQNKDNRYVPINTIKSHDQIPPFQVCNSHLSEFGVLGYEYGYSLANPNMLVLWEAQFGDFANGGQVIIDTFINSGEAKWNVHNGLVMLLPHGYDGQGPEHSNCRVERFLSLVDEKDEVIPPTVKDNEQMQKINMQVVNCSTSANYFHVLRRQMRRNFRKPLVVISPKKLLRFKEASSDIEDFGEGLRFKRVIHDQNKNLVAPEKVKRLIFCTGQVYYDLNEARNKEGKNDIAIVRVEQLAPFPFKYVVPEIEKYKNAEVMWVQEEPQNYGAWYYMLPRLINSLKSVGRKGELPVYAGRDPQAASSTGYSKTHEFELKQFLKKAMTICS